MSLKVVSLGYILSQKSVLEWIVENLSAYPFCNNAKLSLYFNGIFYRPLSFCSNIGLQGVKQIRREISLGSVIEHC